MANTSFLVEAAQPGGTPSFRVYPPSSSGATQFLVYGPIVPLNVRGNGLLTTSLIVDMGYPGQIESAVQRGPDKDRNGRRIKWD